MKKIILVWLSFWICSTTVFAGGYQVKLQGNRQIAMGLIGASLFGDASSAFYNPGALSKINGKYSLLIGGSAIFSKTEFNDKESDYSTHTDNPTGTPFYLYASALLNDRIGLGVGIYTPFGSTAKWGDDWLGANLVQDISMMVVFIQPTVSYKLNDAISIGAGFVVATGSVELNRAVVFSPGAPAGQANLEGTTTNFGFNAGVAITPCDKLNIGVDYRSEVVMKMEGGDATFDIPAAFEGLVPETNKFDADLPLPANLDIGVSYNLTEKFLLAAEANIVFWETYDSLKFKFEEKPEMLNSSNPRKYKNTVILRLGGEYVLNEKLIVRAGAYYDPTPTNKSYFTPETPSLNTYGFSAGLSFRATERLSIDMSYLHLETQKDERSYEPANFAGTYKGRTRIPGIGLSYKL